MPPKVLSVYACRFGADSVEVELVVVLCASVEHKEQLAGTNIYIYKREATTPIPLASLYSSAIICMAYPTHLISLLYTPVAQCSRYMRLNI